MTPMSKEIPRSAVPFQGPPGRERRGLGARVPIRSSEEAEVGRRLERDFYRDLSGVLRKWEADLAALEESKRRRVVLVVEEIGLLRVILDARRVVRNYERSRREG